MNIPYLDIHTHNRAPVGDSINIASLSQEELRLEKTPAGYSSAGIHPWWLDELTPDDVVVLKKSIENLLKSNRLWAIGETGFDRLYPESMELQKEFFHWHFDLAEQFQLPLIIHNVRSGSDFLEVLKKSPPTIPWIFHDFRGNEELVKSLLNLHPQIYFSFGISIDNSPQVRELLPIIPMDRLFLETDNQRHLDIHDIYLRASEQLKVDLDFIKAQIWHNFKKLNPKFQ